MPVRWGAGQKGTPRVAWPGLPVSVPEWGRAQGSQFCGHRDVTPALSASRALWGAPRRSAAGGPAPRGLARASPAPYVPAEHCLGVGGRTPSSTSAPWQCTTRVEL